MQLFRCLARGIGGGGCSPRAAVVSAAACTWIDYPEPIASAKARSSVARSPVPEEIVARVVTAVSRLREHGDLYKLPGVGETIV